MAAAGTAPEESVREIARLFTGATRPLIMVGRVSSDPASFALRVVLAERLGAVVLTDIKTGASFPTQHPLHPFPPSLYVTGGATQLIRDADVILSLDWIDLGGTLRQACGGELPRGTVIQCSVDQYVHNGYNMDHQALPPTDLSILAPPDTLVGALVATLGPRTAKAIEPWSRASGGAADAPVEARDKVTVPARDRG